LPILIDGFKGGKKKNKECFLTGLEGGGTRAPGVAQTTKGGVDKKKIEGILQETTRKLQVPNLGPLRAPCGGKGKQKKKKTAKTREEGGGWGGGKSLPRKPPQGGWRSCVRLKKRTTSHRSQKRRGEGA